MSRHHWRDERPLPISEIGFDFLHRVFSSIILIHNYPKLTVCSANDITMGSGIGVVDGAALAS